MRGLHVSGYSALHQRTPAEHQTNEAHPAVIEQVASRPLTATGTVEAERRTGVPGTGNQGPARESGSVGAADTQATEARAADTTDAGASAGADEDDDVEVSPRRASRKRPKPGERRLQILQTLAEMLELPKGERVTTAALAAKLSVSEAALYRHFASKAQMFEGLIEFIESTLFGLINQITTHEEDGFKQLRQILTMLLSFAERNPGMTRVLIGDALVNEDDRLQARINQLVDRLELSIKQSFRTAVAQGRLPQETDPGARANLLLSYVQGRWLRFAKGGFKRLPTDGLDAQILQLIM